MKHLLLTAALMIAAICSADTPKIRVYAYPAMIYDNGHCGIYQDYLTDIGFNFFYVDKRILDLKASGSRFFIEIPDDIELVEAGVMDRWKTPTGIYTKFPQTKKVINGRKYIRYELPIPTTVLQPTIKKPLPGGMFGGTTNNLVTLQIKPKKALPPKSMIYWEITGKYAYKGQFSVFPVKLDLKGLKKSRIVYQCGPNLPVFGYSRRAIADQVRLFKDLKIDTISVPLATGLEGGTKDLWDKAGFSYYGGGSLMHVYWYNPNGVDRGQKIEDRDFLTGIDGMNGRYISKAAYHGRAFCPQAIITPGRYPYKKLLRLGREIADSGAKWLDIDLEPAYCIQCYCAECRAAFFKFIKKKPENLSPVQLVRKYPKEWYYFRNEQTRQLYQILKDKFKKDYPGLKIGANSVLHGWDKDLGELKYGTCSFAEDPRLMEGTLEFVMADTLMGGMYDGVTVDAMARSTKVPIIAVAGCSYCVGYTAGVMCGRRMTAEMTGDSYGYEQRYENHRLSILHIAASGAVGLRFGINEAIVAKASLEAMKILKEMEDFYLDGKRADEHVAVADLTKGVSRWGLDKSRVRGGIWKYFYDNWGGKVQSRTHTLNGDYSVGLYNWDPWQTKKWHVRMKNIPAGKWYLTEVRTGKRITLKGRKTWTTAELNKGFVIDVPNIDCRIIKFTRKPIPASGEISLVCEATKVLPYNQYFWRTGGQHDFKQVMERHIKNALNMRKRGNPIPKENRNMKKTTAAALAAIVTTLSAADFPMTVDFKDVAKSGISATVENNAIVSQNNYRFATMKLPAVKKNLMIKMKATGKNAKFGLQHYDLAGKQLGILTWLSPLNGTKDFTFIIPAAKLKTPSQLSFYSIGQKAISITALSVAYTDKTTVAAPQVKRTLPAIKIPFKADLKKNSKAFSISGKAVNNTRVVQKGYCFGTIYLPVTKTPISFSTTLTAKDGATLGILVFELNAKNQPGKVIHRGAWGKRLGQASETVTTAIPAIKKPAILLMYNVAKKGTLIIENIEVGSMK